MLFEIKQSFTKNLQNANSLNHLRQKLQQDGFKMKVQYKGEFKPNQKNEIHDVWINRIFHSKENLPKDGFFYKKFDGFSLSAIDDTFAEASKMNLQNQPMTTPSKKREDSLLEIAEELIDDVLKPHYVAQQEDEWWKKKRRGRR